ncbi:MAG: hypothetical protein Kow0090_06350 [Myxococcota bacterium]
MARNAKSKKRSAVKEKKASAVARKPIKSFTPRVEKQERWARVSVALKRAVAAAKSQASSEEKPPVLSIVIPIHNEASIVGNSVSELVSGLREFGRPFEIILAENGSTDSTVEVVRELEGRYKELKMLNSFHPNYGRALKQGILFAKGDVIVCDEIDLCDIDFYQRAFDAITNDCVDMVIGSKLMEGARDNRPLARHLASHIITGLLKAATGLRSSDTHGLKAFRRDRLLPIVRQCVVENDLFASELVIRAEREGFLIREIPITVEEKRPPSINLVSRVPRVLGNLVRLTAAIRFGRSF